MTTTVDNEPILRVKDLKVYYDTPSGQVKAVDGVSFNLKKGERLGLVGESGSGKTTMAIAIMRMTKPPGHIVDGEILLDGVNLLDLSEREMDNTRLAQLALVPQGAMNSLNPVIRVGRQVQDGIIDHSDKKLSKKHLEGRVAELLTSVGLQPSVASMYPHELSGGMKQRVALAIGTALRPKVIVADEPTSALDVVVQRQIMLTLETLQNEIGASVILVGHDMGLMAQFVDKLGVMYAGEIIELAPVEEVFQNPLHPYTKLLISSLPQMDEKRTFAGIPGLPPTLVNLPSGCYFHPRCPSLIEGKCETEHPLLKELKPDWYASCHLYDKETV